MVLEVEAICEEDGTNLSNPKPDLSNEHFWPFHIWTKLSPKFFPIASMIQSNHLLDT